MNTHLTSQAQFDRQPVPSVAPRRMQRGFTLIEIMVVLSIMSILLSITVPSMTSLVDSVKLSSTSNMLLSSMRLARSEAIKRGGRVALCKSVDGTSCSNAGGWEQGWIVFHDANANGEFSPNETLIERVEPLARGLMVSGNQNVARYMSFNGVGMPRTATGGMLAGTMTLCHQGLSSAEGRQIVISSGGRPRVQKTHIGLCA